MNQAVIKEIIRKHSESVAGYPFKFRTTNIYQLVKEIILINNIFNNKKKPLPQRKTLRKITSLGYRPFQSENIEGDYLVSPNSPMAISIYSKLQYIFKNLPVTLYSNFKYMKYLTSIKKLLEKNSIRKSYQSLLICIFKNNLSIFLVSQYLLQKI